MALTGQQFQEFWEALRAGFTVPRLREMVRFGLDKRLDDITVADNLRQIVFDLIQEAEMAGYTMQLLQAARRSQPGNEKLLAFAQQFGLSSNTPALEKIVRENLKFLPITQWRTRLGEAEVRVCRVETGTSFGTGFLLGPDLVLTNFHVVEDVLKGQNPAANVVCRFDYRRLADGKALNEGTTFRLHARDWQVDYCPYSPVDLKANPESELPEPDHLDYALLRLDSSPGAMAVNPQEPNGQPRGWFKVPAGSVTLQPGDPLHIVQHPDARPLELALDTEAVLGVNGNRTRVRYRTNTEPGSSGSPCCDAHWDLVALHHVGDPRYGAFSKKGDWNQGILFDAIVKRLNDRKLGELLNQMVPQV
jgi:V8-like Glu-specific endopeptidase